MSGYRLARSVIPVGFFRKRLRSRVRDVARRRSLTGLRTQKHRSGWPLVVDALGSGASEHGLLLDDFVERTFHPHGWGTPSRRERASGVTGDPITWTQPWIGIFHHPPNFPEWFQDDSHPRAIISTPRFQASRPYLQGAVALSQYLAKWLEEELQIPTVSIKHPTEFPPNKFSWEAFVANDDKALIQVGWFLRNYRAIYQVPEPAGLRKMRLAQDQYFIHEAERRTDASSPYRTRPEYGPVGIIPWQTAARYDELFTRNILFLELFDASANNVVIEAIARQTPVVVNRHPAVMEYLGDGYPLYYDDICSVPALLDQSTVKAAHDYLCALDKSDLTLERFVSKIEAFASSLA